MSREQNLEQVIKDQIAYMMFPNKPGICIEQFKKGIYHAVRSSSILEHCDPETMKQAGWAREEDWIGVDSKPKTGYYLCYDPNLQGNKIETYHYNSYNDSWYLGADTVHPSHYKPLPQPPKQ